uniref:Thioredoxin domain-containing protein n=1 Tax=Arcella intermedia TaxID=1963864 RepID=A0A6B2LF34_9EUKA
MAKLSTAPKQGVARYINAWTGLAFMTVTLGSIMYWYQNFKMERNRRISVKTVGKSRLGGSWTLVDQNGNVKTSLDYQGQYQLLYFGFTFCPEICPTELKKLSKIVNNLDKEVDPKLITPIFISLDPWRDSVEQIGTYVKQFNKRFTGLTGTPGQCEEIAKKFRVYSTTNRNANSDEEDYIVDHSIWIYLMDKEGKFLDVFGVDKDAEDITKVIKKHLILRQDIKLSIWAELKSFMKNEF